MKKLLLLLLNFTFFLAIGVNSASAHSISIGYENAGPGAVTVWLGTYQHGGHHLEGSMQLEGVNGTTYAQTTLDFNMLTGTGVEYKPAGLIDGTTNFFVQGTQGNNLPLVGSDAQWLSMYPTLPANHWQGVTFSGLSPGDYQFTWVPAANPSQEWSPWSQSMNGVFHLSGEVTNPGGGAPVPEPTTMVLAGIGLIAIAGISRRKINH